MEIKNEIYYHLHKQNKHDIDWKIGQSLVFNKNKLNDFLDYYNYTEFTIKGHSVINAMEIVSQNAIGDQIVTPKSIFDYILMSFKESRSYISEVIFEEVRKQFYNDLPSRFNCIYVCEKKQIEFWRSHIGKNSTAYELELTGRIHKADISFLKSDTMSIDEIRTFAHRYWQGIIINEQSIEYLFEGNVIIKNIIV